MRQGGSAWLASKSRARFLGFYDPWRIVDKREQRGVSPRAVKRGNQLERCYRLAALLIEGQPLDRKIVAAELGISEANADRHLRAIRATMKATAKQKGGMTVVQAERDRSGRPLNKATVAAACIAASLARVFHTSSLGPRMKSVIERILEASHDASLFREYERQFLFIVRGGERALHRSGRGDARLDTVIDAIVERRQLRLRHERFDGSKEETYMEPLSLALHEHQLYVLGFVEGSLKNIRFSRVFAAFKTRTSFKYPPATSYDPGRVFRDSLGIFIKDDPEKGISVRNVKIRLDKKWLPYVKGHRWHPSQRHRADGEGVVLHFRLRTCLELERMILGFGPDAEVLEPADLRAKIAARARSLAAIYDGK